MPTCKNCKTRIDKFNKDRCPICGIENPFEGTSSDTVEITTNIDTSNLEYHPKTKRTMFVYFVVGGIIGLPFFYIYKKKVGIVYASINIALLALGTLLTALLTNFNAGLALLIYLISLILINTLVGLFYVNKANLKDGHGGFVE